MERMFKVLRLNFNLWNFKSYLLKGKRENNLILEFTEKYVYSDKVYNY